MAKVGTQLHPRDVKRKVLGLTLILSLCFCWRQAFEPCDPALPSFKQIWHNFVHYPCGPEVSLHGSSTDRKPDEERADEALNLAHPILVFLVQNKSATSFFNV